MGNTDKMSGGKDKNILSHTKIMDRLEIIHKAIVEDEKVVLYLSRRDKRLVDNPALSYAISLSDNVVLGILPELLVANYKQRIFLSECLCNLQDECKTKK